MIISLEDSYFIQTSASDCFIVHSAVVADEYRLICVRVPKCLVKRHMGETAYGFHVRYAKLWLKLFYPEIKNIDNKKFLDNYDYDYENYGYWYLYFAVDL